MYDPFFASHPYVTVAVNFDKHTTALVRLGAALAERLGKKLCLMHVVEPIADLPMSRPFAIPAVIWDKFPEVEASTRDATLKRLAELAKTVPPSLSVQTVATRGAAAATLASEAAELGTSLLLVGVSQESARFAPIGLSTAVSLLAAAPIPVMVVDTEKHVPDLENCVRILLADDLTEQSEAAVNYTAALADACGKSWVHHVHVNSLTSENLQTALVNAAAAAHTPMSTGEAQNVFRAVQEDLRQRLEGRFNEHREYIEAAGGSYTAEVVPGSIKAELDGVMQAAHPDVLVFGRHKAWHKKPFLMGRMPFRAMLSYGRPVIVVPNV